jgi:hypothetical protein
MFHLLSFSSILGARGSLCSVAGGGLPSQALLIIQAMIVRFLCQFDLAEVARILSNTNLDVLVK